MELWLIYALLSALFASLVAIFGKIGLQSVDANTVSATRAVVMAIFLLGVVFVQGNVKQLATLADDKKVLFFVVMSGVAGALSWLFYFLALKDGKVSQVAPIDKLSVVLTAVIAVVVLKEKISFITGLGICLIAVGVLLTTLG
ncbi:MAG: EamA family transporter [Negativicutes bacterium]|nr:EamA family transporter [Negativicutes bacterium]